MYSVLNTVYWFDCEPDQRPLQRCRDLSAQSQSWSQPLIGGGRGVGGCVVGGGDDDVCVVVVVVGGGGGGGDGCGVGGGLTCVNPRSMRE